uniref:Uncharacterized protein n=1 Tax=Utricularia reniformis TaxID=192314 RepID=A0A1Y0AZW8_9LAMI|nr:hypothetical protein AEK19_MT0443 [Utricularia reniformis]ART30707.1 hypothetical protein AEK19_MT0443 [Utricularia reniformis]
MRKKRCSSKRNFIPSGLNSLILQTPESQLLQTNHYSSEFHGPNETIYANRGRKCELYHSLTTASFVGRGLLTVSLDR